MKIHLFLLTIIRPFLVGERISRITHFDVHVNACKVIDGYSGAYLCWEEGKSKLQLKELIKWRRYRVAPAERILPGQFQTECLLIWAEKLNNLEFSRSG